MSGLTLLLWGSPGGLLGLLRLPSRRWVPSLGVPGELCQCALDPLFILGNLIGQVLPDCGVPRHCLRRSHWFPDAWMLGCACVSAPACLLCALTAFHLARRRGMWRRLHLSAVRCDAGRKL